MDFEFLTKHWYADIYEQQENQIDDVQFLLEVIGKEPKKVLEVACGGGRISVPLAKAGHTVTGFDSDSYMLEKCKVKAVNLPDANFYLSDAVEADWGNGYDIVVLAGNILLNIESGMEYIQAQQLLIRKAYACLRHGGYLYLATDNNDNRKSHSNKDEWVIFEGTDDLGTYGRYSIFDSCYDSGTQITTFNRRTVIVAENGEKRVFERCASKHFPRLCQVEKWVCDAGFEIEKRFGDFKGNPLEAGAGKIIIWAQKAIEKTGDVE